MAPKKKKAETPMNPVEHVKYVAKAGMWCTTLINEKGQSQQWTATKP